MSGEHRWRPESGISLDSNPPITPYKCTRCGTEIMASRNDDGSLSRPYAPGGLYDMPPCEPIGDAGAQRSTSGEVGQAFGSSSETQP